MKVICLFLVCLSAAAHAGYLGGGAVEVAPAVAPAAIGYSGVASYGYAAGIPAYPAVQAIRAAPAYAYSALPAVQTYQTAIQAVPAVHAVPAYPALPAVQAYHAAPAFRAAPIFPAAPLAYSAGYGIGHHAKYIGGVQGYPGFFKK